MCGIAGLIHCGGEPLLRRMTDVLTHRGADSQGLQWWPAHGSGFGHRRLAILDLSPAGHQPMATPDGRFWITYKAAMAASIETRPPLADFRIVEKMFTLPPRQRICGNTQKQLLKKVSERYLPREIVHRPKAPFNAPLRAWMRGPLAAMVDDLLSESSLRKRGFYDPATVRGLIDADRRGIDDHGMVIWTLLTTELWFRTFFDKLPS
jgi:asparagine synthetase B (glutamine-hydrolysing)